MPKCPNRETGRTTTDQKRNGVGQGGTARLEGKLHPTGQKPLSSAGFSAWRTRPMVDMGSLLRGVTRPQNPESGFKCPISSAATGAGGAPGAGRSRRRGKQPRQAVRAPAGAADDNTEERNRLPEYQVGQADHGYMVPEQQRQAGKPDLRRARQLDEWLQEKKSRSAANQSGDKSPHAKFCSLKIRFCDAQGNAHRAGARPKPVLAVWRPALTRRDFVRILALGPTNIIAIQDGGSRNRSSVTIPSRRL